MNALVFSSRKALALFVVSAAIFASFAISSNVRENNGGNCVDTKSCRPRCMTFRIYRRRAGRECSSREGIFASDLSVLPNPWDLSKMNVSQCRGLDSGCTANDSVTYKACRNSTIAVQAMWSDNLLVHIRESGFRWSFSTELQLPEGKNAFTFCSIYPCPRVECALPEQMGSDLRILLFQGGSADEDLQLLETNFALQADFVGVPLWLNDTNRFGPIRVEWMDDPTGCRPGFLSEYAPVAPIAEPNVTVARVDSPPIDLGDFFCQGREYDPSSLPITAPLIDAPTSAPTSLRTIDRRNFNIQLWFASVENLLNPLEILTLNELTDEFLRSNGVTVHELVVLEQHLMPAEIRPESCVVMLPRVNDTGASQMTYPTGILVVLMEVEGGQAYNVATLLRVKWDSYVSLLSLGMDAFMTDLLSVAPSPSHIDVTIDDSPNYGSLILSMFFLGFAATATAFLVHNKGSRRRREQAWPTQPLVSYPKLSMFREMDGISLESDRGLSFSGG